MDEQVDKKPKLSYTQIEHLEEQGKKITGLRTDTWQDGKGICATCRNSTVMRRETRNERYIKCSAIGEYVPHDITECNSFQSITELTLGQMADIAVLLDYKTRKCGFASEEPKDPRWDDV